jgi:hypothetical protein
VVSSRLVLKLAEGATSDPANAGRESKASVECTRHEAEPEERLGTGLMSASAMLQNVGFRRIGLTDGRPAMGPTITGSALFREASRSEHPSRDTTWISRSRRAGAEARVDATSNSFAGDPTSSVSKSIGRGWVLECFDLSGFVKSGWSMEC